MKKKMNGKATEEKQNKKGYGPGIKLQLIVGFIIPILFLIFIGIFTYEKMKESLINNYEEATLSSISMGSKYLDFGFETAVSDTLQLTLDSSLADYAYGRYQNDPAQANSIYKKIQSSILVKEASNSFMDAVHVIPKSQGKIMTTDSGAGNGFYEEWEQSGEGAAIMSGKSNFCWVGSHPFIDEKMHSSMEDYAVSYVGVLTNKAACVVIDISKEAIMSSLKGLNLGKGSLAAFVTADNREITYYNSEGGEGSTGIENLVFSGEEFFTSGMEKEELSESEYITYNGTEYLFMYSKSEINDSSLCALVPRSSVIQGAEDMRNMNNILVIIACITVAFFAVLISANISGAMGRIIRKLKMVSGGDLTVQLSTGGRSEFSRLSQNIMGVIGHTRALIQKVEDTLGTVTNSTNRVATVSDRIWENAENIAGAVKDIDDGVSNQSGSVQNCAVMMGQLSDRISAINQNVLEVERFAGSTQDMITEGISTIDELSGQSYSAREITEKVQEDVGLLDEESSKIKGFVDIINDISRQTNLLSLNASIEAARAGQAGRGFSVVADEIQKLAEESMRAAKEIENVVSQIQMRMAETVNVADEAKEVAGKQVQTVEQTQDVFERMGVYIKQLLGKLSDISESATQADKERVVTVEAIENISAVSVQTAASSSIVSGTVDGQLEIAETLKTAAGELDSNLNELTEALAAFKIR